ncbi:MAG: hypothetical protein EOP62_16435 [Sphingomonadales bacterium]|nr:MAG: hypothetical protein EOP62_16435 [Sphingomonadales bacterium]
MPDRERVIAVGLLTARDLERLGANFSRSFPIEDTPCFGELLAAIDDADRVIRQGAPTRLEIPITGT